MPRVPAALLIAAAVGESCWDMAGEGLREKDEECSRKGKSEHFLWPKLSNNNRAREGNRPVQTTDRRVIHLMIDENWLEVSDLADYSSQNFCSRLPLLHFSSCPHTSNPRVALSRQLASCAAPGDCSGDESIGANSDATAAANGSDPLT